MDRNNSRIHWLRFLVASLMALAVFGSFGARPAQAVQPGEILKDEVLEKRAREISSQLRCLVCQNQSIDDSNAPLAHDLRVLVRERLTAGDKNDEVFAYVVARYGEYVLLKPPFNLYTLLLWLAPFLVLFGSSFLLYRGYRARGVEASRSGVTALSEEEKAELKHLLSSAGEDLDKTDDEPL